MCILCLLNEWLQAYSGLPFVRLRALFSVSYMVIGTMTTMISQTCTIAIVGVLKRCLTAAQSGLIISKSVQFGTMQKRHIPQMHCSLGLGRWQSAEPCLHSCCNAGTLKSSDWIDLPAG